MMTIPLVLQRLSELVGCDNEAPNIQTPAPAETGRGHGRLVGVDVVENSDAPTSVYRYYDRFGVLIYVGITKQAIGRNYQHNLTQDWWQHVASQEVEHHPDRRSASLREKELIRQHRPPFNKAHNLGWRELREAYLSFIEALDGSVTPVRMPKRLLVLIADGGRRLVTRPQDAAVAAQLHISIEHVPIIRQSKKIGVVRSVTRHGGILDISVSGDGFPRHDHALLYIRCASQKPLVIAPSRLVLCTCGSIPNHIHDAEMSA